MLGRPPHGHHHPPRAADALPVPADPLAPGDRPRGEEGPHGRVPHVRSGEARRVGASTMLGGQVGSKASNSHFFPPIFIFHVVKSWEELGGGGHVQWGEAWEAGGGSPMALCCRMIAGCSGVRGC